MISAFGSKQTLINSKCSLNRVDKGCRIKWAIVDIQKSPFSTLRTPINLKGIEFKSNQVLPKVKMNAIVRFYSTRNEDNNKNNETETEKRNDKIALWLFVCCGLVFIMVIIGGVTRLTESGLSITDWRPITGSIPPLSEEDWEKEFEKYSKSPEFKQLNPYITITEFKSIFWMEWAHRAFGRMIGFAFGLPFLYFLSRGWLNASLKKKLSVFLVLGGMQGFIGWWMVKSGLEEGQDHPRVSPYRLALHLGSAFVIYLGLLWTALGLCYPAYKQITPQSFPSRTLRYGARSLLGLTFLTAMSGAFVAGLDAGLLYPEIPKMGHGYVPEEYWDLQPPYKNFFENGAAAQFNHRLLATTTYISTMAFWFYARRIPMPKPTRLALHSMALMANIQVALGIATLLYYVPTPLAATHQAGSLTLLTMSTIFNHQLRILKR